MALEDTVIYSLKTQRKKNFFSSLGESVTLLYSHVNLRVYDGLISNLGLCQDLLLQILHCCILYLWWLPDSTNSIPLGNIKKIDAEGVTSQMEVYIPVFLFDVTQSYTSPFPPWPRNSVPFVSDLLLGCLSVFPVNLLVYSVDVV